MSGTYWDKEAKLSELVPSYYGLGKDKSVGRGAWDRL